MLYFLSLKQKLAQSTQQMTKLGNHPVPSCNRKLNHLLLLHRAAQIRSTDKTTYVSCASLLLQYPKEPSKTEWASAQAAPSQEGCPGQHLGT